MSRIGDAGRLSEKRLAKALGLRQRPASGALQGAKGDMEAGQALIEAKSTVHSSIKLELAWLAKIAREARAQGKTPALTLSFTTGDGRPVPGGQWVCIPLHEWVMIKGD
jgi:hypothetical protein